MTHVLQYFIIEYVANALLKNISQKH